MLKISPQYSLLGLIAALYDANSAAEITPYGKINLSYQSLKDVNGTGATIKDNWEVLSNASRLGFKGNTPINDTTVDRYFVTSL